MNPLQGVEALSRPAEKPGNEPEPCAAGRRRVDCGALVGGESVLGEENVDPGVPPLALDKPVAAEVALEPEADPLQDPR